MDTVGLSGQSVVVVLDRGLVKVSACMFMANRRPGHLVVPHCWLLAQIFIEGVAAAMGTQARIVQKLEQVLWSFQPPNTTVQIFETKNLVFVDQCNVCVWPAPMANTEGSQTVPSPPPPSLGLIIHSRKLKQSLSERNEKHCCCHFGEPLLSCGRVCVLLGD